MEEQEPPHVLVFVDETGFNLSQDRHGRDVIGHQATTGTLGQLGGIITMYAAIPDNGVSTYIPQT